MNQRKTGGCACGAVRDELLSEAGDVGWFHCRICQINSGAPAVATSGLVYTSAEENCGFA